MNYLIIDGAQGEGGGQVLRTALTLSMLTKQAIEVVNIRAKRKKPGLLRQHLTCVLAAQQICDAETTGFGAGAAAGIAVGSAVVTAGVGIAIAMGPVGWVILIGAGLAAGKAGDALGQGFSGLIYDISADINWF